MITNIVLQHVFALKPSKFHGAVNSVKRNLKHSLMKITSNSLHALNAYTHVQEPLIGTRTKESSLAK